MARLRVLAVTLVITLAMLASAATGQLNPLRDFELTAGTSSS